MDNRLKYANHASPEFNRQMEDVLGRIAIDTEKVLGDNLVALLLGGGYGRGEGGVVVVDGVEHPYNDLDMTFIVKDKGAIDWKGIHSVSHKFEQEIHIDVDFSRPLTIDDVRNWSCWLMWYDLLNGHIVMSGDEDILYKNAPDSLKLPPSTIEATRLVLNRGAGLLWALRVIRGEPNIEGMPLPDKDFIRRNYYKCCLAMGDGLLITYKRFTTAYSGRDKLLNKLIEENNSVADLGMKELYEAALEFKFSPDSKEGVSFNEEQFLELAARWGEVFLHIERIRTDKKFASIADYSNWSGLREPEQHALDKLPRNIVRSLQHKKLTWKYPREQLYRQLPHLIELTGRKISNWSVESERFLKVWNRFN